MVPIWHLKYKGLKLVTTCDLKLGWVTLAKTLYRKGVMNV